jgi:hypothetical protein
MRKTVRTKSYYGRKNFVCHLEQKHMYSEQIRIRVTISCYYSLNKILIARTTYYSSEKNLHLISKTKNINGGKNI